MRADEGGRPRDPLEGWREHILLRVLRWGTVLLFLPWLLGTWAALDAGMRLLAGVTSGAYLLLLGVAAGRRLSFRFRAGMLLLICWGVGVAVLVLVGPLGAGILWLAAVPVLATFLFGLRGAAWGIGVVALTSAALAVLAGSPAGLGPPEGVGPGIRYDLPAWLATAGSVVGLGALLSIPFAVLLRRTAAALQDEREARRALEAEAGRREALELRLEQARRLESLGTFAGGIAHDFNNLLVPILGEAEELERRLPVDSPEAEAAGDIVASATRARELVRSILAFSRAEREAADPSGTGGRTGPDDGFPATRVGTVLEEVGAQLRRSVPHGVTVVTEDRTGGMAVASDALRLHQLLMNLATNGWLAMEETGGTLRIEARREARGGHAHPAVCLYVEDGGVGMDTETLRRAFDPFFTTRPTGKGTGLGLSTVHGIVGTLGGAIHIDSEPGRGTRVEVVLPALEERSAPRPEPPPNAPEPGSDPKVAPPAGERGPPVRVLVVDDDASVRGTTARALVRFGFQVHQAEGGREALDILERARSEGVPVPVVLTDLMMPEMDGAAVARAIRERHPESRVILVTGNVDGVGAHLPAPGAPGSPVAALLRKPFRLGELEEVVRGVLRVGTAPGEREPEGGNGL